MNTPLEKSIYEEAKAIGDSLINSSIEDNKGLYWVTFTLDDDLNVIEQVSENMYNGVSGIAIYLLDLYKISGVKKYLSTALRAMEWAFRKCEETPPYNYGFYTGRTSIAIAALRFYDHTKDISYLKKGLKVFKSVKKFNPGNSVDDLIGGNSGTLLGLLHMHAYTNERWLLKEINKYTGYLLNKMNISRKGIYWDRNSDYVSGLCGFSHGAAGLGFVFLELGKYLRNNSFFWLAEKAFEYESQYFNKDLGNWADLRRHKTTQTYLQQQKDAFLNNDFDFFTKNRYMNAWCHGAAGIGLSRLRAYEILKNKKYLQQAKTAVKTTAKTDLRDTSDTNLMIYCHGNGGNADLFIESYLRLGTGKYMNYARQVAAQALKQKKDLGFYKSDNRISIESAYEDLSLFTGTSGIGHYYLRTLSPSQISSVLMPVLNKSITKKQVLTNYEHLNISEKDIKLAIYNKVYPKTISVLKQISHNSAKKIPVINGSPYLVNDFRRFFVCERKNITREDKEKLSDIYKLESLKIDIDYSVPSFALLDIQKIIEKEKNESIVIMDEAYFLNLNLKLNNTVFLHQTKWNWKGKKINHNPKRPGEYFVMLKQQPKNVAVNFITPFIYVIGSSFKTNKNVRSAIEEITQVFEIENGEQKKQLNRVILTQIKELISSQHLTIC